MVVESIAFDKAYGSQMSSKPILVGTNRGQLYETVLESSGRDRTVALVRRNLMMMRRRRRRRMMMMMMMMMIMIVVTILIIMPQADPGGDEPGVAL
jgi:hypothetical protein